MEQPLCSEHCDIVATLGRVEGGNKIIHEELVGLKKIIERFIVVEERQNNMDKAMLDMHTNQMDLIKLVSEATRRVDAIYNIIAFLISVIVVGGALVAILKYLGK